MAQLSAGTTVSISTLVHEANEATEASIYLHNPGDEWREAVSKLRHKHAIPWKCNLQAKSLAKLSD